MSLTSIEWAKYSWNPVTGCEVISPGCANCYAKTQAERFKGSKAFPNGFAVTLHPERLDEPFKFKEEGRVFVPSMGDLFHKDVPDYFIRQVFDVMQQDTRHDFLLLTKRPERLAELAHSLPLPDNLWTGVSVENQHWTSRMDVLRNVPSAVRFLSCEPLLGPLELNLSGIDQVIVGGESGAGARRMQAAWARSIRDQCLAAGVAFFFKQWGRYDQDGQKRSGKHFEAYDQLDGRRWHQVPVRA